MNHFTGRFKVRKLILSLVLITIGSVSGICNAYYTSDNYSEGSDVVDRNGYHYYRGSDAGDRRYEAPYYNNTGYFNTVNCEEGKYIYYNAYSNYNNGYYKGGFYGNEYYHNGEFNNGYYNPGNCRGINCRARVGGMK